MDVQQTQPETADHTIPDPIAEMPLPQTETFTVPPKKPVGKILSIIFVVIIAVGAGVGYALVQNN